MSGCCASLRAAMMASFDVDDGPMMRTAPLGVVSGAVVGVVTEVPVGLMWSWSG